MQCRSKQNYQAERKSLSFLLADFFLCLLVLFVLVGRELHWAKMKIEPVMLKGRLVRLEPLQMKHASELYEASRDPGLWTYKPVSQPRSLRDMEQLIASVLQSQQTGACLPFAILCLKRGCAVGETR